MTKTDPRALYLALLQDAHQRGELLSALPPRPPQEPAPAALASAVFPQIFRPCGTRSA